VHCRISPRRLHFKELSKTGTGNQGFFGAHEYVLMAHGAILCKKKNRLSSADQQIFNLYFALEMASIGLHPSPALLGVSFICQTQQPKR
jgi:hypothetical protein